LSQATIQLHYKQNYTKAAPAIKQHCTLGLYTECSSGNVYRNIFTRTQQARFSNTVSTFFIRNIPLQYYMPCSTV